MKARFVPGFPSLVHTCTLWSVMTLPYDSLSFRRYSHLRPGGRGSGGAGWRDPWVFCGGAPVVPFFPVPAALVDVAIFDVILWLLPRPSHEPRPCRGACSPFQLLRDVLLYPAFRGCALHSRDEATRPRRLAPHRGRGRARYLVGIVNNDRFHRCLPREPRFFGEPLFGNGTRDQGIAAPSQRRFRPKIS